MSQIRLFLTAPKERAEALYQAFELIFEEDGLPLAIAEIDESSAMHEVSVYSDNADRDEERMRIAMRPKDDIEIRRQVLPDIDWVAKSLEGLKAVRFGRFLVHGSHERASRRPGDIAIEIEAGRAFGTGHHATTAGCLLAIAEIIPREHPGTAIDLGTGSAVLAIAMAKLSRIPVIASDIDPVAIEVAKLNTRHNGVAALVTPVVAAGFGHRLLAGRRFDLVVANVLAKPLMRLAPDMARHLRPGGSLILSGILAGQRRAVIAAYVNQGFRYVKARRLGEWVTLQMKRR